jgi:hypothetical protein
LFEPTNVSGDIVYAGDPCRGLPLIEDVDHPPLEVLSPKDGVLWMAAASGRVIWGDPFVVAMSDYDDKLAVGRTWRPNPQPWPSDRNNKADRPR